MNKPAKTNVIPFNTSNKFDYKIVSRTQLIIELRIAYVAACKAIGLVNKLKASYPAQAKRKALQKSKVMSLKNKILGELKKFEKDGLSLFESVAYRGILINKF